MPNTGAMIYVDEFIDTFFRDFLTFKKVMKYKKKHMAQWMNLHQKNSFEFCKLDVITMYVLLHVKNLEPHSSISEASRQLNKYWVGVKS